MLFVLKNTVSGCSKGGYITLHVSTIWQNDKINFVEMGGCGIAPPGKIPQILEGFSTHYTKKDYRPVSILVANGIFCVYVYLRKRRIKMKN